VTLPIELKRELFPILSADIRRQLRRRRLSERDVQADFSSWRKTRRRRQSAVVRRCLSHARVGEGAAGLGASLPVTPMRLAKKVSEQFPISQDQAIRVAEHRGGLPTLTMDNRTSWSLCPAWPAPGRGRRRGTSPRPTRRERDAGRLLNPSAAQRCISPESLPSH
jgi:hypothetical protein